MSTTVRRFWAKVARKSQDDCWLWRGATAQGYGRFRLDGRLYNAHRVAWAIANSESMPEELPKRTAAHGVVVRHKCDNRLCCNPRHLEIGTQKENVADTMARGRWKPRIRAETVPHSKSNGTKTG